MQPRCQVREKQEIQIGQVLNKRPAAADDVKNTLKKYFIPFPREKCN